MVNFGQVKGEFKTGLTGSFPEYTQVFKDWEGKASLMTLRSFPLPQEIVSSRRHSDPEALEDRK